jgi:hypothetical protein
MPRKVASVVAPVPPRGKLAQTLLYRNHELAKEVLDYPHARLDEPSRHELLDVEDMDKTDNWRVGVLQAARSGCHGMGTAR